MLVPIATDWTTISSLATGVGTLVLAIATFASVRSSNRSARIAEEALLEQRRPVLSPSRFDDPKQKIMYVEGHWVTVEGGRAVAEHSDGTVYLAISLRNVGSGIGVCQGWVASAGMQTSRTSPTHRPLEDFRPQSRDLYIPAGDVGMWQGALRDHGEELFDQMAEAIEIRDPITIELLYSDQVGGQRTITRFGLTCYGNSEQWIASVNRHWYLDRPGPRSDEETEAAQEQVLQTLELAREEAEVAAQAEGAGPVQAEAEAVEQADGDAAAPAVRRDGAAPNGGQRFPVERRVRD
jgi:hypothetical protein